MTSCSASVWNKQVEDDDHDDAVREVGVVSDPAFFGKVNTGAQWQHTLNAKDGNEPGDDDKSIVINTMMVLEIINDYVQANTII